MPQREYEITIDPNGTVEVHVKGFKGKSCLEAARFFEEIIGEVEARQFTSEYYEPDEQVRFNIEQQH